MAAEGKDAGETRPCSTHTAGVLYADLIIRESIQKTESTGNTEPHDPHPNTVDTWKRPNLTPDASAKLAEHVEQLGASAIARKLVPDHRSIGILAAVGLAVGAVLGFISDYSVDDGIKRVAGTVGAVLFAWGFLQLPVYILTLLGARDNCKTWLLDLQRHGPRLIKCECGVENAAGQFRQVFSIDEFKKCLEYAREDEAKLVADRIPIGRRWELWARILYGGGDVVEMTSSRALVSLVALAGEVPQLSDRYLINLDTDGKVIVRRQRRGQEERKITLGALPVSRKG